jgi:hypothetical protein
VSNVLCLHQTTGPLLSFRYWSARVGTCFDRGSIALPMRDTTVIQSANSRRIFTTFGSSFLRLKALLGSFLSGLSVMLPACAV